MFQKVVDWLDMIRDRIANDFDGPFARIREGIGLIKQGWGELVRGIQAGDWALAWRGVQDIVVGVLYAIEGSVGAFLDWLDALTGGRFHEMFEGLKTTMHGIVEFTEGVLRGDWALALQGLSDMVGGVLDTVEGLFDGFVNWLDELTGGHFHEVFEAMETLVGDTFDGIQETFDGLLKFIDGVFKGDLDKALEGVRQIISGAANTVKGIVNGLGDTVKSIVNGVFNWLRDTFPQITPLLNFIERAISGTIDGVLALVNGAINMIQRIVGGAIDFIVGLITGDSGKIIGGLRGIVNGLIDALNGALRGVEGFVNWVTGGISDVLNWLIPNGGWSFSITLPRIPYLAQGAVIPPNREFLAVLGDQRRGNNIEAPESLMRQVVAEETGRQVAALMASMQSLQGGDVTLVLRVGNEELARATSKGNAMLARRGLLSAELVV